MMPLSRPGGDKLAVCAIFKDEAVYLLEWLAFHRMIGVDLFVLYDNGSTDGGGDLIRGSSFARNVTLVEWLERPGQLSAYRHFRINYAPRFTWVAFIDIDEFIMPLAGGSIRDILMRRVYAPYAQILLQWLVFGPSGHQSRPEGLVIENYIHRLPSGQASLLLKTIVRTDTLRGIDYTPHATECSGPACNTRGQTVLPYAIQPTECHDVMVVKPLLHQIAGGLGIQAPARPRRFAGAISGNGVCRRCGRGVRRGCKGGALRSATAGTAAFLTPDSELRTMDKSRHLRDFQGRGAVSSGIGSPSTRWSASICSCCTTTAAPMAAPT